MKWRGRRQSSNVEDRRGDSQGGLGGLGGGRIPSFGGGSGSGGFKLSGGTIIIAIILYLLFGGGDLGSILGGMGGGTEPQIIQSQREETGTNSQGFDYNKNANDQEVSKEELDAFASTILADTEDVWNKIFADYDMEYNEPKLVIFDGQVRSGCGLASSQMGPFYCGADNGIYVDLSFYDQLHRQFGASGDFAFAYVIAHEVGHHVQNELGSLTKFHEARARMNERDANELSVRNELQADYFAGVFAKYIQDQGYMERGDMEEAITAAGAVGDDTIQKKMAGYVDPDSFTHGTSEQRMRWFQKGFQNGTIEGGDTFNTNNL